MEKDTQHKDKSTRTPAVKKKRSPLKRIALIAVWIVGVMVALVVLLFCGIAWILTPQRLTPIVEKAVNDNIGDARFSLGKAVHISPAESRSRFAFSGQRRV